jgi:hypothetical protein
VRHVPRRNRIRGWATDGRKQFIAEGVLSSGDRVVDEHKRNDGHRARRVELVTRLLLVFVCAGTGTP